MVISEPSDLYFYEDLLDQASASEILFFCNLNGLREIFNIIHLDYTSKETCLEILHPATQVSQFVLKTF